jgi:hypothetical protein
MIKHKDITNFARAQRLGWFGYIERMPETRMAKAIHSWKPISKRPTGRPKTCWEDDIKKDIQKFENTAITISIFIVTSAIVAENTDYFRLNYEIRGFNTKNKCNLHLPPTKLTK